MLPNWLYGKSKSKLADILGGGTTYTAGPGISISSNSRISFRGDTAPYDNSNSGLEADTVKGALDELADDITGIIGDTSIDRLTILDPQPSECLWTYAHIYDNGILLQTMGILTLKADISVNSFITVGTLPEGHRPKADRQLQCAMVSGNGTVYGTSLLVRSNGNVQFNVRGNMKTNDQYLTYGVVLL